MHISLDKSSSDRSFKDIFAVLNRTHRPTRHFSGHVIAPIRLRQLCGRHKSSAAESI